MSYIKGRGAQSKPHNKFEKQEFVREFDEGVDDYNEIKTQTDVIFSSPKTIVNRVDSPDLGFMYSMNPYQGCEHGCVYCYARNSHEYWGLNAGLDFERKIIVKREAPALLVKQLNKPSWEVHTLMLSGNTDCYQPLEKKFELTRQLLKVCASYKHPVGIITKNSLICRDLDLLGELAIQNLVAVNISITSLDESLRRTLEPRTASVKQRFKTVETLAQRGIPVNIMVAPIIPGLTDHEIPEIIKRAAEHGANSAGYTIVRLNGQVKDVFSHWIHSVYPTKAAKVLNQIAAAHGGKLNDSRWSVRQRGEGQFADLVKHLFNSSLKKHMPHSHFPLLRKDLFLRNKGGQLSVFN